MKMSLNSIRQPMGNLLLVLLFVIAGATVFAANAQANTVKPVDAVAIDSQSLASLFSSDSKTEAAFPTGAASCNCRNDLRLWQDSKFRSADDSDSSTGAQ
ncbi:MAG: hypothetical protein COT74_05405 [Bdellovibrionales bacterium CG10_big_fil_rev_8_21_14_0_10_45_34]|nr:MAG: hypothetical protein COT74_05405 [Bdellovibrionales bacterium CG10_big_fil_rev_8_21_14_0_10_45_34]